MITTDDFVKILLAISLAFAIIGISFVIMRLINKLTGMLEDVRKPVQNVSELSDLTLSDYKTIRSFITSGKIAKGAASSILKKMRDRGEESENE